MYLSMSACAALELANFSLFPDFDETCSVQRLSWRVSSQWATMRAQVSFVISKLPLRSKPEPEWCLPMDTERKYHWKVSQFSFQVELVRLCLIFNKKNSFQNLFFFLSFWCKTKFYHFQANLFFQIAKLNEFSFSILRLFCSKSFVETLFGLWNVLWA